jgi:hypothetical protein
MVTFQTFSFLDFLADLLQFSHCLSVRLFYVQAGVQEHKQMKREAGKCKLLRKWTRNVTMQWLYCLSAVTRVSFVQDGVSREDGMDQGLGMPHAIPHTPLISVYFNILVQKTGIP